MTADRRWRIYYVGENALLHLFLQQGAGAHLLLPVPANLPPGARVLDARHSWDRKAFAFRVEHPSFDAVPDGDVIPEAGRMQWELLRVMPDGDSPEGQRAFRLLDAALEEAARLRGVFGDLCQDSPAIQAAYEQGKAEGVKQEREPAASFGVPGSAGHALSRISQHVDLSAANIEGESNDSSTLGGQP